MITLTQEQMMAIVNAANLAIAKGYTLKTPYGVISGMLIHEGELKHIEKIRNEPGKYVLGTYQ